MRKEVFFYKKSLKKFEMKSWRKIRKFMKYDGRKSDYPTEKKISFSRRIASVFFEKKKVLLVN